MGSLRRFLVSFVRSLCEIKNFELKLRILVEISENFSRNFKGIWLITQTILEKLLRNYRVLSENKMYLSSCAEILEKSESLVEIIEIVGRNINLKISTEKL